MSRPKARVPPLTQEQRMYWKSVCQKIVQETEGFEESKTKMQNHARQVFESQN